MAILNVSVSSFRTFATLDADEPSDSELESYISGAIGTIGRLVGRDLKTYDLDNSKGVESSEVELAVKTLALYRFNSRDYLHNKEMAESIHNQVIELVGGLRDFATLIQVSPERT